MLPSTILLQPINILRQFLTELMIILTINLSSQPLWMIRERGRHKAKVAGGGH